MAGGDINSSSSMWQPVEHEEVNLDGFLSLLLNGHDSLLSGEVSITFCPDYIDAVIHVSGILWKSFVHECGYDHEVALKIVRAISDCPSLILASFYIIDLCLPHLEVPDQSRIDDLLSAIGTTLISSQKSLKLCLAIRSEQSRSLNLSCSVINDPTASHGTSSTSQSLKLVFPIITGRRLEIKTLLKASLSCTLGRALNENCINELNLAMATHSFDLPNRCRLEPREDLLEIVFAMLCNHCMLQKLSLDLQSLCYWRGFHTRFYEMVIFKIGTMLERNATLQHVKIMDSTAMELHEALKLEQSTIMWKFVDQLKINDSLQFFEWGAWKLFRVDGELQLRIKGAESCLNKNRAKEFKVTLQVSL